MSHLELRLLGTFQARLDGLPVTGFESGKVRALLAYLAVESDGPHTRDELAVLLWPDQPDQTARTNLRQALANLRQAIGDQRVAPPFLVVTRDSVQFNRESDYSLDVTSFTHQLDGCARHAHRHADRCRTCSARMEQAVALYRGDLLLGLNVTDSVPFEEWATLKRESLHQRALDALTRLAASHERRGEYERAKRCAARQLELDPWREEAHRQTMRLLARMGQRSTALDQYERCRRILGSELGVEPARETTWLYEHIRDGSNENDLSASAAVRLPASLTPLVGREREIAELVELVEDPAHRLVTITGTGGVGKTRLAMAAAGELAPAFIHGAAFVSLAALSAVEFLVPAILAALDVPLQGKVDPKSQLLAYLRDRELLLIIDNWEHLLPEESGVELLAEMLQHAPGLTVLATSRERLGVQAEWLFDLQGLDYPQGASSAQIKDCGAIQLFMQRARQAQRRPALDQADLPAVARICQLVEGLPLAIELAAASVSVRSCAEIASEIQAGLGALASRFRDAPERHRSVWAAFEHSWNLLSEQERRVLRQVSVFRGGWQAESAAQVAGATLETLTALADKSLLRRDASGRFDMHELVRQYAHEKLTGSQEVQQVNSRHLDFFAQLAEAAEPGLRSANQVVWLERLEDELDNLRVALAWSANRGSAELGLRLAGALWRFWILHGHIAEGLRWLDTLLAQPSNNTPDPETASVMLEQHQVIRATMLWRAAYLTFLRSAWERAAALADEGISLSREVGDRTALGFSLVIRGAVAVHRNDWDHARALYEESLTVLDKTEHKWHTAAAYYRLGILASFRNDDAGVEAWLDKSLTLFRDLGDRISVADTLLVLGEAAHWQNNTAKAIAILQESLDLYRELGVKGHMLIHVLGAFGNIAFDNGNLEQARQLYQECLARSQDIGFISKIGEALYGLALVAQYQGDADRATELLEESMIIEREHGDQAFIACIQRSLGDIAALLGKPDRALRRYAESLMLAQGVRNENWEIASSLRQIAAVLGAQGHLQDAARLFGASESIREETGRALPPLYRADYERAVNAVRAQLGESAFKAAWTEGRAMTLEQVIELALSDKPDVSKTYEFRIPVAADLDRQATAKARQ